MTFDRATFLRPIAHRGLHNAADGVIENTLSAARAAIAAGYAIECDVQKSSDNIAMVFHDEQLERLTNRSGRVSQRTAKDLQTIRHRGCTNGDTIVPLADFLNVIEARVPLIVEIKSDWSPPAVPWLAHIAGLAKDYSGPIALFSFDPDVMSVVKHLATGVPIGLVSGHYRKPGADPWWPHEVDAARAEHLTNLGDIAALKPDFIAYHIRDLDHPAALNARNVLGLPLLTWTVRTEEDLARATRLADAPIFEHCRPQPAVPEG